MSSFLNLHSFQWLLKTWIKDLKILFDTIQGIFTLTVEQEERITEHIYEAFLMITEISLNSFCYFDETGKHFHAQDLCAKCQFLQKGLGATAKSYPKHSRCVTNWSSPQQHY